MKRPDPNAQMEPTTALRALSRRHFLRDSALGLGGIALSSLIGAGPARARELEVVPASGPPLPPGAPHFAPRAKNVIFLFMAGGPSQIDLFDDKPILREHNGQPIPESVVSGERFAFIRGRPKLIGSPYRFARHGQAGVEVSELLPHFAGIVDDVAIVRSMHTNQFNHGPGQIMMNTGHQVMGRPSMGSWLSYGLGSENEDLPAFMVMLSGDSQPDGGKSCWSSGFLPTVHQGVEFRARGEGIHFLKSQPGVSPKSQRRVVDTINALNGIARERTGQPEIDTRIAAYEMAFRMQSSVPELLDLSSEPAVIREMYGVTPEASFANHCLLARRMVERGVRFVQLYHRGWDHHGARAGVDIVHGLTRRARETDQAAAALVRDLKQRGLLDETLVIWGGEFGRTPMNEERGGSKLAGRDHHPRAFTMWLAGGGIRPGTQLGSTDEFGYEIVEDPVSVHDLHATALHLLGLDHTRLTYSHLGRDFRLTDVFGNVVPELIG